MRWPSTARCKRRTTKRRATKYKSWPEVARHLPAPCRRSTHRHHHPLFPSRRSGKAAKADDEVSRGAHRTCRKEKHRFAGGCAGCDPHEAGCKDGARVTGCIGCNPTTVCFYATVNRRADGKWIVGECRPFTCRHNHAGRLRTASTAYTSTMLTPLLTPLLQIDPKASTKALTAILAPHMNLAPNKSVVVEAKRKSMESLFGARRTLQPTTSTVPPAHRSHTLGCLARVQVHRAMPTAEAKPQPLRCSPTNSKHKATHASSC